MSVHRKLYVNDSLYAPKVYDKDFPSTRWEHLSTVDQYLAKDSDVKFNKLESTTTVSGTKITASNGIDVTGGSVVINAGDLTLDSGELTLTLGDLNVSAGTTHLKATNVVGATNITGVTGVDGKFTVTASGVEESIELTGPTDITGDTMVSGAFEVLAGDGKSIQLTGTTTITGVTGVDGKFTVTASGVGESIELNGTTDITGVTTITGATTITGSATVSQNLTVTGDLTVSGTTTTVLSQTLEIKDNTILLNKGDTGNDEGVTLNEAGIEIERGSEANVSLLYKERTTSGVNFTQSYWEVGTVNPTTVVGGTHTVVTHRLLEATALFNSVENNRVLVFDQFGRAKSSDDLTVTDVTVTNLEVTGSVILPTGSSPAESIETVSATVTLSKNITLVAATSASVTVNLPSAAANLGKSFTVYFKSRDNAAYNVSVARAGTDVIEDTTSFILAEPGQHVRFTSIGLNGSDLYTWIVR
jgi:hypothetical protein